MRKFTVFTFILTVIIVVVGAEIFVNDYLPNLVRTKDGSDSLGMELTLPSNLSVSDYGGANILGADLDSSNIPEEEVVEGVDRGDVAETDDLANVLEGLDEVDFLPTFEPVNEMPVVDGGASLDFEDESFGAFKTTVYLREDQVKSAGFIGGNVEAESNDGFLFKTIYVGDLHDVEVEKYVVKSDEALLAKVYVFKVGPTSDPYEVYQILKVRGAEGLDVTINETNEFAQGSFYLNDVRRSEVAFLAVRLGSMIYGFSYPKEYHSQIKNLVTLLDLEF